MDDIISKLITDQHKIKEVINLLSSISKILIDSEENTAIGVLYYLVNITYKYAEVIYCDDWNEAEKATREMLAIGEPLSRLEKEFNENKIQLGRKPLRKFKNDKIRKN